MEAAAQGVSYVGSLQWAQCCTVCATVPIEIEGLGGFACRTAISLETLTSPVQMMSVGLRQSASQNMPASPGAGRKPLCHSEGTVPVSSASGGSAIGVLSSSAVF